MRWRAPRRDRHEPWWLVPPVHRSAGFAKNPKTPTTALWRSSHIRDTFSNTAITCTSCPPWATPIASYRAAPAMDDQHRGTSRRASASDVLNAFTSQSVPAKDILKLTEMQADM